MPLAAAGLAVLAAVAALAVVADAGAAVAGDARAGAGNAQIAGLQVALRAYGLYSGAIDGLAGRQTVDATRAFQRQHGLPPTGVSDVRTRLALGPVGGPLFGRRTLRLRLFGWDVAVLQFLLAQRGFSRGPIDGWFDRPTLVGVRRFQRSAGLQQDGVVGPASQAAFARLAAVPLAARLRGAAPLPAARPVEAPPTAVRHLIDRWSRRSGVDFHLARALAWIESGYQPRVVSPVGALGVMQVMPATWDWVEQFVLKRKVPRTTEGNIAVGTAYLRHLLDVFREDRRLAVAAWLQGPSSVRRVGVQVETEPFVAAVIALSHRV